MILDEVVLQRCSGEGDASERLDLVDDAGDGRRLVLQQMPFIANDEVGARIRQTFAEYISDLLRSSGSYVGEDGTDQ